MKKLLIVFDLLRLKAIKRQRQDKYYLRTPLRFLKGGKSAIADWSMYT